MVRSAGEDSGERKVIAEYIGYARWYYEGDGFPLYQIVWPARSGQFPWDRLASAEFKRAQPVIGHVVDNN
jgi:Domain of unknown function (DUF4262)